MPKKSSVEKILSKPKKNIKIAIITEFLYFFGGIEKSILMLVKELQKKGVQVDIYAGIYNPEKTFAEFKSLNVKSWLSERKPSVINTLWLRWKYRKMKLQAYDGYVFYGSHSIAASKNHHPNVWWSTRALAYLYGSDGKGPDASTDYLHGGNLFKRMLMYAYLKFLRFIDQRDIKGVDEIRTVGVLAQIILKNAYPSRSASILYAPVDVHQYRYISKGKFYLNAARHVPDKNVDKVVLAFQRMPDKQLIQSGTGPDLEKIKQLAANNQNIKLSGFLKEEELRELNGTCIATISAAEGEDYSMNLIEGIASGKPTISVNLDRNVKDMVFTETGVLIPSADPENIIKAVKYITPQRAEKMRSACEKKSKLFSKENHAKGIMEALHLL